MLAKEKHIDIIVLDIPPLDEESNRATVRRQSFSPADILITRSTLKTAWLSLSSAIKRSFIINSYVSFCCVKSYLVMENHMENFQK